MVKRARVRVLPDEHRSDRLKPAKHAFPRMTTTRRGGLLQREGRLRIPESRSKKRAHLLSENLARDGDCEPEEDHRPDSERGGQILSVAD